MTDFEKNVPLVGIIPFVPPRVQKIIIDFILRDVEIKLNDETLKEYEEYFKRVQEKFIDDYMRKR